MLIVRAVTHIMLVRNQTGKPLIRLLLQIRVCAVCRGLFGGQLVFGILDHLFTYISGTGAMAEVSTIVSAIVEEHAQTETDEKT